MTLYALVCRFFCGEGGVKKRILLLSLRCRRNLMPCKQKNHRYQRWFVCRNQELPTLSSEGNWLGGAQSPKLSFQCSCIAPGTSRLSSSKSVTSGYRQWRFVVSFRVGLKLIVTGTGVVVGLNGGFVHTVQLGANCLPGTECQAWNEINAAITAE